MSERVKVRPVEWRDLEDLVRIYYECYDERDAGRFIGIHLFAQRPSFAEEVEWFSGLYRRQLAGTAVVGIAEVDGHAVANCTVMHRGPGPLSEAAHVGELGILVNRAHRGRGVGTAAMEEVIGRCRGKFEAIRLSVLTRNEGAIRLYERLGFVKVGIIPKAVKRGSEYFDEEIMVRSL
jgi:RimJ/RimL family protein N-acetyltransferase